MCGRYTLNAPPRDVAKLFDLGVIPELGLRYNIAPTQSVAAVRVSEHGGRELVMLRWGLVPSWAESPRGGARMINARSETVAARPAFRSAFRRRRCLLPATGFYEWQRQGKRKQPYYLCLHGNVPFAFAGLWERWEKRDDPPIESCTVLTTAANELVRLLHDRMPVILAPHDYDRWLDPEVQDPEVLQPLLRPYPGEEMIAYPVSTLVNSPRNEDPKLIAPTKGAGLFD